MITEGPASEDETSGDCEKCCSSIMIYMELQKRGFEKNKQQIVYAGWFENFGIH